MEKREKSNKKSQSTKNNLCTIYVCVTAISSKHKITSYVIQVLCAHVCPQIPLHCIYIRTREKAICVSNVSVPKHIVYALMNIAACCAYIL